jgi:hypothetical protein
VRTRVIHLINPKTDSLTTRPLYLNRALYSPLAGMPSIANRFPLHGRRHRLQWLIYNIFMRRGSQTENIQSIAAPTPEPALAPMPPILPVKREWRAAVLEAAGPGPHLS